jgi:hypothetical protein
MKDLILLIAGLASAGAVYALLDTKKSVVKESFGTIPAQTIKNMPEARVQDRYGAAVFTVPPTWQGNLSPRFSNLGYGAYINYNIPDAEHLAVPRNPLTWSQDFPLTMGGPVREGYAQPAGLSPQARAVARAQNMTNAVEASRFAQNAEEGKFLVGQEALPEGAQIYNYDRLVYAQKKSRLHGLGDPIRGDIPVVPIQGDWFRPSVAPNIDLRQGAITTISGHDNATSRELRALQGAWSGKTALAQKDISFDGRQSDITITAFP